MQLKGIDISEWQGSLNINNFKKIKSDGISFVIIRCGFTGYGKSKTMNVDKYFENNYKLAKEIGLNVGTYYYSCATNIEEAEEEANFVLKIIKDKKFDFPIVIDTEDEHDINNPNYSNTSQSSIGKNVLTPVINRFCEIMEENNKYVSIYASTYWFKNKLILNDLIKYDKWIAQWSKSVNFEHKYGIWQYSSTGTVSGLSGGIDMNYAYIDYPNVIKSNNLNGYIVDSDQENSIDDNNQINKPVDNNIKETKSIILKIFKLIKLLFDKFIKWLKS